MIEFESIEELHFSWFLDELKLNGFIVDWKYHPKPFPLSEAVRVSWIKELKTKQKTISRTLLKGHTYQADFLIKWDRKADGVFFYSGRDEDYIQYPFIVDTKKGFLRSVVDVKGTYSQNDAWRRFAVDQKWVWQRYEILVQKIVPVTLFQKTFTPLRYLRSDKKRIARKIAYKPVISLPQFLKGE